MSDRWALSSKTVCPVCGQKIRRGRDSYACPAPDYTPRHFRCVYAPRDEMAVTNGQAE